MLQKETRKALKCFEEEGLAYLVASLDADAGLIFAGHLSAQRVTLLFLALMDRCRKSFMASTMNDMLTCMLTTHLAQA